MKPLLVRVPQVSSTNVIPAQAGQMRHITCFYRNRIDSMFQEGAQRRQHGSSFGEQLIMLALAALFVVLAVATFRHSVTAGISVVGLAVGVGSLVFVLGVLRDRRVERRREERCVSELERTAAAQHAAVDAIFLGRREGGPAVFGIAGAARKLIYAREGSPQIHVTVLDFDTLAAAFARPDGKNRYRLEIRARASGAPPREALFLTVGKRADAERWISVLEPYLGRRVRMVEGENS